MRIATDLIFDGISAFDNVSNGDTIGAFSGVPASMIGPQPFKATPLAFGTKFVSASGSGSAYTEASPGSLQNALNSSVPGDVIFLRGGTYTITTQINITISGTRDKRITIESFPGELAVLDASALPRTGAVRVNLAANFITFRNIEINGMVTRGIEISASDNIVEHCHIHHCSLSGIMIFKDYTQPHLTARNILRSNICHSNSDAELTGGEYDFGENADGIGVASGIDNIVEHNICYNNSDDGIDIWRAIHSIARYNICYANGYGPKGNGNGVKCGGLPPSGLNLIAHNVSFNNKEIGVTFNSSPGVKMIRNTAWNNKAGNFNCGADTVLEYNAAFGGGRALAGFSNFQKGNSWNLPAFFVPKSTDLKSPNFLHVREVQSQSDEKISRWSGSGNSTIITAIGDDALNVTGTPTAANVSASNMYSSLAGVEILVPTASASAVAGLYGNANKWFRGSSAVMGAGGFDFMCRFGFATGAASTNRFFVGLSASTAAPTDVDPVGLTDMFGFGANANDAYGIIFRNDDTGTATRTNLGTDFTLPTADRVGCFEARFFCEPMSSEIFYIIKNLTNGAIATGSFWVDIPSPTTLLSPRAWIGVGGVNRVVGIKFVDAWVKTRS